MKSNRLIIEETIQTQKKKLELKLVSADFAKGYIYGKMDTMPLPNEEYDELAKIVDDIFQ